MATLISTVEVRWTDTTLTARWIRGWSTTIRVTAMHDKVIGLK